VVWKFTNMLDARAEHQPVLGTVLTLHVRGRGRRNTRRAESALLAQIDRLELVFSAFRTNSEFDRWRQGPQTASVSSDLAQLLAMGLDWQHRSGGLFNPAVGVVSERWQRAERESVLPSDAELNELGASIVEPRYTVEGNVITKLGDCSRLNFNALAKGHVVDLATRHVVDRFSPTMLLVNVGGDLVHHGEPAARVAIEDPKRAYDNAPPATYAHIANCGLATSGSARRGFTVNGEQFSHVIDPRTGHPVDSVASATVVASDAATADVLATVASVATPDAAVAFIDACPDAACLIVDATGSVFTSNGWDALTAYRVVT
jgi:FAD:protein FMN transferase